MVSASSSLTVPPPRPVTVLVIESNAASRAQLGTLIEQDARLRVVGSVASPQTALEFIRRRVPDVVLMDEAASGMGGVEGTRRILQSHAVPIVLCANTRGGGQAVFRAMEAGAVAWVYKPNNAGHADMPALAQQMCLTLRLMSEVKVVRQWGRPTAPASLAVPSAPTPPAPAPGPATASVPAFASASAVPARPRTVSPVADPRRDARSGGRIIGIGASTGGPPVLQTILSGLPQAFDAPLLVVQHMAPGFLQGLADWLTRSTGVGVRVAEHGMVPQCGQVYLAPDGCQMVLSAQGTLAIRPDSAPALHQPSVAALFDSLAEVCGPRGVGVLLTGMGRDGAAELKRMRERGAVTIAQDRESSVVHGMPGEAIALGGATYVLPPGRIASTLVSLLQSPLRPAPDGAASAQ